VLLNSVLRRIFGPKREEIQSPVQLLRGALSLGVKRPGREAHHSIPSSAEVKEFVELYLPQYAFMAWCLVKHMDKFTFTFKREEIAGGWRRLHNEELHNL
jgi:hypothetical protein